MNAERGTFYRTAFGHAGAIVDASRYRMGGNIWSGEDIPLEAGPMSSAIARKMRVGDREPEARASLLRLIRLAVGDVLEGRQPRW